MERVLALGSCQYSGGIDPAKDLRAQYSGGIDPAKDLRAVQEKVESLHSELVERLRLTPYASGAGPYAVLDTRTKKRWRAALMRFVDLCSQQGWEFFPPDIPKLEDLRNDAPEEDYALARASEELPFYGLGDFECDLFDELLSVWKDGSGTKRSGGRSKWLVLEELLAHVWGDATNPRQLKKEWIADSKERRPARARD